MKRLEWECEIYDVARQLWKIIMFFFLSIFPKYLAAEAKQRIIFLYSRQDLKPITTNIQGFSSLGNCIRMQNHKTPKRTAVSNCENTWSFHLWSGVHLIISRHPWLLCEMIVLCWSLLEPEPEPDLGITRNIKNQFYEAMRLNVFLYSVFLSRKYFIQFS